MKTIPLRPTDDGCARAVDELRAGGYVNGPIVSAVLDLTRWPTFADYEREVERAHKDVRDNIARAKRLGYRVEEYAHRRWLEDVVAIDRSKPVRCGGKMKPHYMRTVEERGGADPNAVVHAPVCPRHWRRTIGVFGLADHGRGPIIDSGVGTVEMSAIRPTLVAYSSLVRTDDLGSGDLPHKRGRKPRCGWCRSGRHEAVA